MSKDSLCADECLKEIILKYSETVYRLACSLLKSRVEADDIHQEVFMRYIKNPVAFQSEEHEKAWFLRVTVNCCKNYWKSAWFKRRAELTESDGRPEETGSQNGGELIETVKTLPQKYRAVIHLFYYEDMTVEEISRLLEAKPSTVRTRLSRARKMLKEKLKEEI